jgi:putative hydrolase of the HAD superfamily
MYQAILFDIDDTLYSYQEANVQTMPLVADYVHRELGVEREPFLSLYARCMEEQLRSHSDVAGCHSRAIRFQMVLERLQKPLYHAAVLNDLYWNSFLGVMKPFPRMVECFRTIRNLGLRTGVCSDMTTDWQLKKLQRLGVLGLLDFVVTSEEAGVEKPNPDIFRLCARKAECEAEECLFIGDNLNKDVRGAQGAGMCALWFQPDGTAAAEIPDVRSIQDYQGLIDHIKILKKEYVP